MRLFVGLPFSLEVQRKFLPAQQGLEKAAVKGNFTAAGNFHLTLAFLGEVEDSLLPHAFAALVAVPMEPVSLSFRRLDFFEGGVCYLAPDPCPPLIQGQERLALTLREQGLFLERRPFTPHVTLGRKLVFREGYVPSQSLSPPIQAQSEGARLFLSHRVDGVLRYDILRP